MPKESVASEADGSDGAGGAGGAGASAGAPWDCIEVRERAKLELEELPTAGEPILASRMKLEEDAEPPPEFRLMSRPKLALDMAKEKEARSKKKMAFIPAAPR